MPAEIPVALAYVVLVVAALCRGSLTYTLGRLVRRAGDGSRLAALFRRPAMLRTEALVRRFGAPVVSLSFLTVGVQSAVNASAGVLRMPLRYYVPALAVGSLMWAGIYLSVGMAMLNAWYAGGYGWFVVAAMVLLLVALATVALRRREGELVVDGPDDTEDPDDMADMDGMAGANGARGPALAPARPE